jgi:hypothetical protein
MSIILFSIWLCIQLLFRYDASLNYPNSCFLFRACENPEDCGDTCDYSLLGKCCNLYFSYIGMCGNPEDCSDTCDYSRLGKCCNLYFNYICDNPEDCGDTCDYSLLGLIFTLAIYTVYVIFLRTAVILVTTLF